MGEQKRRLAAGAEDLRLRGPRSAGLLERLREKWKQRRPWRGEPGDFGRRQRERAAERRAVKVMLSDAKRRRLLARGRQ